MTARHHTSSAQDVHSRSAFGAFVRLLITASPYAMLAGIGAFLLSGGALQEEDSLWIAGLLAITFFASNVAGRG